MPKLRLFTHEAGEHHNPALRLTSKGRSMPDTSDKHAGINHVARQLEQSGLADHQYLEPSDVTAIGEETLTDMINVVHGDKYSETLSGEPPLTLWQDLRNQSLKVPNGEAVPFLQDSLDIVPDDDVLITNRSWDACLQTTLAIRKSLDALKAGEFSAALCATRPGSGHHVSKDAMSGTDTASGFCLLNFEAIAARYAQELGFKRVAIIDFDAHNGNGTQTVLRNDPNIFFASTHPASPTFPFSTVDVSDGAKAKIINRLVEEGSDGEAIRKIYQTEILPELQKFKPDIVILTSGFDAHKADRLGTLGMKERDYYNLTKDILAAEDVPVLSLLGGGYTMQSLAGSLHAHGMALAGGEYNIQAIRDSRHAARPNVSRSA